MVSTLALLEEALFGTNNSNEAGGINDRKGTAADKAVADKKRCVPIILYPFIHLYSVHTPMYTRYTCIYTTHTPLNTFKHLQTPYIHPIYTHYIHRESRANMALVSIATTRSIMALFVVVSFLWTSHEVHSK